jgi:nitrate/nitrite transport system permease protein
MMNHSSVTVSNAGDTIRGRPLSWLRGTARRAEALAGGRSVMAWQSVAAPLLAMLVFLALWSQASARIETTLGRIPGPLAVWQQVGTLWADHTAERAKAAAFYAMQEARNARILAQNPAATVIIANYTGKPTYIDQIVTSLQKVFTGFLLASLLAIPLGILCGLSATVNAALSPFIQIFRPVSPLAWLPIVTLVVSALYVTPDPLLQKSFINSAITVALCSLWPTATAMWAGPGARCTRNEMFASG